jgi:protein-disulfide isomerase
MVVFEDPQCPYCRKFEEACGDLLRRAREDGTLAVEYRMRCFLGVESVRADNALALAAEENLFDELRKELFSAQPQEGTGGFTTSDLLFLGRRVGLTSPEYASGLNEGRYDAWVLKVEETFQAQDPQGTPAAWLDGHAVDPRVLSNSAALWDLLRQHR